MVAFSVRLLQIGHRHTSGTLDAISPYPLLRVDPEMCDSVDVTLTNPVIAGSLQSPDVAKKLVSARITPAPTQRFFKFEDC
jgi:hypothetical protein